MHPRSHGIVFSGSRVFGAAALFLLGTLNDTRIAHK
jgi:hypothetical protein